MASPRIIMDKSVIVYAVNICSKCGLPVISNIKVSVNAQKTYSFSSSKAEEICRQTIEEGIEYECRRIEDTSNSKMPLTEKSNKKSMIWPGHFCTSTIQGYVSACPNCLNVEPWKSTELATIPFATLKNTNYPKVYRQKKDALALAERYLGEVAERIEEIRCDRNLVGESQIACSSLKDKLKEMKTALSSTKNNGNIDILEDELRIKTSLIKDVGFFGFSKKRELNARINAIKAELALLTKELSEKQQLIKTNIITSEAEYRAAMSIANGLSEKIDVLESNSAVCFTWIPKEEPEDDVLFTKADEYKENDLPANMYCRKCGATIMEDSVFCSKCGERVVR